MRDGRLPVVREAEKHPPPNVDRRLQELWLVLARHSWNSLAVLPASPEDTVGDLVQSLALVGKHLSLQDVTAVTVKALGPSSATALATLADLVRRYQDRSQRTNEREDEPMTRVVGSAFGRAVPVRLVLGIPSVLAQPVGVSITAAVDAVVLGVDLGRTSTEEVRRSIEKIGRAKLIGACLL